jgi:parvulin-like peptidyl-prolyl cis-trans isomerase-like protein
MRGLSLVSLSVLLVGCGALRDAFTPRAEVVARANDQALSVERLAAWTSTSKQVPLEALAFNRVSHVWVDYALFAEALASGQNLHDSATAIASMWPIVSQIKWEHFHDRLTAHSDLTPQQLDSAYQSGQLRMFQHILIQVPANAAATVDAQKRKQAEHVLAQARTAGPRFGQLAKQYSQDNSSKVQGGSLGVSARGQFVPAFEEAAWKLEPGAVSAVVKSPFGYHIIRRPPLAEVADSFRAGVEQRVTSHTDSLFLDSLATTRQLQPVSRAATYVRTAVQDPDASRSSSRVLVEYRGGALRVRDLIRWLSALDPGLAQALPQATDDQISQFLKAITQRDLLIREADSAKVGLTPDDWQQVRTQYDSAITRLGSILSITPAALRDSAGGQTQEARVKFAIARVNDYMDRVLQGRVRFFPVPAFLGETLRDRARWGVDEAGVRRALERAQEIRLAADSTRGSPPGGSPRMMPAPGPAPIDTAHRRTSR